MRQYFFWATSLLLRRDVDKRMVKVAPAVVGFCRENTGKGYPEYNDDLAPFEMTLDSLLSDFDLELVGRPNYCSGPGLTLITTGDGFYIDILDNFLRLTAPLFRDGSEIIMQSADDGECLYLYKLIRGKWKYRSQWKPVFSGKWNPI